MITKEQIMSSLVHVFFAVLFQCMVGFLTQDWFLGALGAVMFYLGREHAQHEYKIAGYLRTGRSVKDLKPWEGFDIFNWGVDSTLDWVAPLVVTVTLALILS